MGAYELLEGLLEAMAGDFPQAEFRAAYGPGPGSRLAGKIIVAGQVGLERWKQGAWEGRLDLTVFLPRGTGPEEAEPLLAGLESAAREASPGFGGMERKSVRTDQATGLLTVPCTLEFAGGGGTAAGTGTVLLGGKTYQVAGWRVSAASLGKELVSIGEDAPFFPGETQYTVELEGIDTAGLEALASFTARLGESPESYLGCRWKSLGDRRAVFVSVRRQRDQETGG